MTGSAAEVHSLPPWHGGARQTEPFSGLKLLWRERREIYRDRPHRCRHVHGSPDHHPAGPQALPLYSAGRMLDLV
jgi:hypothetical protein